LVVVDPGWDSDEGWEALTGGLAAAGASLDSVTGIVLTHVHPDHHGMTARLALHTNAWIAMHPAERDSLPRNSTADNRSADLAWMAEQGMPAEVAAEMSISEIAMKMFRAMPDPDILLADGDLVPLAGRLVKAIWTPGHTPGHLCLHDENNGALLTGDHILPRISPNIGLQPHSANPPLGPYLDSLRKLSTLETVEVLPAHEWRFRGLNIRISQLLEHHRERCLEITGALAKNGEATAWQVTERITWSRGWAAVKGWQRRAALAETLAHLIYLEQKSLIVRLSSPGVATIFSVAN
jgi:glyoxylase-like metal-dependent hydrolase (beta-lactamase superfamily II)